jgi:Cu(I)/Ag(I) efflux system membrane protein CusA/SilA
MGVVVSENILRHLGRASPDESRLEVIHRAASEVSGAVLTAISTTVVSFLPVFTMEAAEGKLFKPLAYTKTFALIASVIVALTVLPPLAHLLFSARLPRAVRRRDFGGGALILAGVAAGLLVGWWLGIALILIGAHRILAPRLPERARAANLANWILVVAVGWLLASHWLPLGAGKGELLNFIFVALLLGGILFLIHLFQRFYESILRWCLAHKRQFLILPGLLVLFGGLVWLGFDGIFGVLPAGLERLGLNGSFLRATPVWTAASHTFPGLGEEFMPALDEGSYLYMPTTMPHASIGEALDVLQKQDMAISAIPEVESVVGKIGRVESPLDPAPVSMIETVINYKSEYLTDERGHRMRFRYDRRRGDYARDESGKLIPDSRGRPYRQWRDEIRSADDIWDEIVKAAQVPGTTSAPKLQPIAARIVMLQSGMRAPMGVKVKGPDLETIERVALEIEQLLKEVPSVAPSAVIADRIVGKPYIEIDIDREAIARYGISVRTVQDVIEIAIGGRPITITVEGRERYPVRVRYARELRDQIESLARILVPAADRSQIPLEQLAEIRHVRGPQAIKSEDTFLVAYVLFDMRPGHAESYSFAGSYENQIRSEKKLMVILPLALLVIFLILYFQFRSVSTTLLVFSGIFVAWAGGFLMIGLYGQEWFLDFQIFGVNARDLFQVHPLNLSVAVWVGFLALFGIATDDGVIIATYLRQTFAVRRPQTVAEIREATVTAGRRRIRPALMTVTTTILALIPVLTSTGRGSDIMVPMAIPSFGGMTVVLITVFVVPTLYSAIEEWKLDRRGEERNPGGAAGSLTQ